MTSKAGLKAIKALIDAKDFPRAVDQASKLTKDDPKNQTAFLFLGFASDKLDQNDNSEKAYQAALRIKPLDQQALKGLVNLYEKQTADRLDQYHEVVLQLAQTYADQDDRDQCQSVIDKYELFAKKHGSRAQYRHALELLLPTSPIYSLLKGRIPHPSHTYTRLLEVAESEEKDWINKQIGERRTRLGAKLDQVTQQVHSEASTKFDIEDIYAELINWMLDDQERHRLEERLLLRLYENLKALPHDQKPLQRDKVVNLANGMVIIKHPFMFAWQTALDWVDGDSLTDWDPDILRTFIELFPMAGLNKVLRGFLTETAQAREQDAYNSNGESEDQEKNEPLTEADRLILMTEGIEDCADSLLATRIMAETYLALDEFESASDAARKSQALHYQAIKTFSLTLQNGLDAISITLANALITFQSPRHHPEAKSLFEEVLLRKPLLTAPLLGIGLILEEDEDYTAAIKFLERAAKRDESNNRIQLELAWSRALAGVLEEGLSELERLRVQLKEQTGASSNMKAEVLYRIAYCKWHLDTSTAARKDKDGPYKDLIGSIKSNPSYAPAYTLLGIYFQDYGKSKQRARVALQKAFELSTAEVVAAHRLAIMFAGAAEWDLVELVAQRVIASGKARPAPGSKKKAFSWPFAALGGVQINKQQYGEAIVSFQSALRISPNDYYSWVGLGECYHNSGRFVAATRTFTKAESLDHGLPPDQTWFAKYMLANVQREMGSFDEAIAAYEEVLKIKDGEFGVLIALLLTLTESASAKVELGMFGRASALAERALAIAGEIANVKTDVFNLWKAVADAFTVLGVNNMHLRSKGNQTWFAVLHRGLHDDELDLLSDIDRVNRDCLQLLDGESTSEAKNLYRLAAIVAAKRAVYAITSDRHAQAIALYNLGWAEYHAYAADDRPAVIRDKSTRRFLKASIKCFKHAIELEARNPEFWDALGVVTMTLSPKISQHSFVRSLHLNEHSARTWTNLGALYLLSGDQQLANEAFTRAQSADPEYAHAWVGQGLIASLYGNSREARGLFVHGFEISTASSIIARRHFAFTAFDHLLASTSISQDAIRVLQPLFATRQVEMQTPSDVSLMQLTSLFAERAGSFDEAVQRLAKTLSHLKQHHSPDAALQHHTAHADIGRVLYESGAYQQAVDQAMTSFDDTSEGPHGGVPLGSKRQWMLSAHLTAGLAHYQLKDFDQSIAMFESAQRESHDAPDVACLLAQALWTRGGEEDREAARGALFACVADNPGHVMSTILLSVIGLVDGDEDVLDAVEEDLMSLRISDAVTVQERLQLSQVLSSVLGYKSEKTDHDENTSLNVVSDAATSIMLAPGEPQGWHELADATGDFFSALMALRTATRQIPPGGTLSADTFANALAYTGRREDAMKALMIAPWKAEGFQALAATVEVKP